MIFKAVIKIREGNPYIHITPEQAVAIKSDWKKPLPVVVQINGKPDDPWHINMMPIGDGGFYLYLHGDVRKASQTKVGDEVTVTVGFDSKYKSGPQHPLPIWFKEALDKNSIALENWQKLIPSRQKEILRYLFGLKTPESQERNLKRAMSVLSGNSERFMARSWKKGS